MLAPTPRGDPINATILGLGGAVAFAVGSLMTKHFVDRLPPLQLIGPLYLLNAAVLVPLAPFTDWHWTTRIGILHLVSLAVICGNALAVFRLLEHGAASAVTTATATSPFPTVLATALLIPSGFSWTEAGAAALVVGGVLWAVSDSFQRLRRAATVLTAAAASVGTGMTAVMSRLLLDEGAGLVEIYVVRTLAAGALFTLVAPPRDIPRRAWRWLGLRSGFITFGFSLSILGLRYGSPALVQTMLATMPLFVIAGETFLSHRRPDPRVAGAAVLVAAGVALVSF